MRTLSELDLPRLLCFVTRESKMVLDELAIRLNDEEYKNWLKAGRCLLLLQAALHPFVTHHMRAFHGDLLNQNTLLRRPCQTSCRAGGNKLSSPCGTCSEWQKVILRHHRHPDSTVNWDNCFPPSWRTDHWELAKAYMPRGQGKVKGAHQCDTSALLNLINYCKYFQSVHPQFVTEVIRHRNELMHSCEMRVNDRWMKNYQSALKNLVHQFSDVPQMERAGQQIEVMLTVDLSIYVSGLDQLDSTKADGLETDNVCHEETSAGLISQWEAELLQQKLQELLHAADDTRTRDTDQLKRMGVFLQANKDLGERFSGELQAINCLTRQ